MAHPNLDRLLSFCIPFAQEQLQKRDAFLPFSAAILGNDELRPIAIDDGVEHPKPSEMIASLGTLLRTLTKEEDIQATAICYDGRVTVPGKDKQDAITVALEHANGEALTIYLPYAKKFLRGYQYEEIIGTAGEPAVFTNS